MEIVFASFNEGKIREIREILSEYEILSLKDIGFSGDIEEDAPTFYGNALKKAREINRITGLPTIADDSGLCIKALNGFPGVLTHRFLGCNKSDRERNKALIEKCLGLHDKSAAVVCSLVYVDNEEIIRAEGEILGRITDKERGKNGFGFDSIFETSTGKTLAEMTSHEKNMLSSRSLAAQILREKLCNKGKMKKR